MEMGIYWDLEFLNAFHVVPSCSHQVPMVIYYVLNVFPKFSIARVTKSVLTGHSDIKWAIWTVSILVVCQSGDLLLVGGPIKEVHHHKKKQ